MRKKKRLSAKRPTGISAQKYDLMKEVQEIVEKHTGIKDWHPVHQLAIAASKPFALQQEIKALMLIENRTEQDELRLQVLIEELEAIDPKIAHDAAKEVAKYVAPQLKAVEVSSGNEDGGAVLQIVLNTETGASEVKSKPGDAKPIDGEIVKDEKDGDR